MKRFLSIAFLWLVVCAAEAGEPATLLQMAGVTRAAPHLGESVLVIIDAQREYLDGALPLAGIAPAIDEAAALLTRARRLRIPVIHVLHHNRPGSALFDPERPYAAPVAPLAPRAGETIIIKRWPDAFADTSLETVLQATGRKELVVVGFATHMCVSSTVRAALARGYRTTVVAAATATRDLPGGPGTVVPAATMQQASLAALADRFALVTARATDLPD